MTQPRFGPLAPTAPDGITVEHHGDRVCLRAGRPLSDMASGFFAHPNVYLPVTFDRPGRPEESDRGGDGVDLLGFSFTQFGLPVRGSYQSPFLFDPADHINSPPAVIPLLARRGDDVWLLAPLDSWHEQIIAVVQDDDGVRELRWGWHGDLDQVEEGFSTTLGLYRGRSASALVERWGQEITATARTRRAAAPPYLTRARDSQAEPSGGPDPDRRNPLLTHLSYWTDNGAAYWYRTEPGLELAESLAAKLDELGHLGLGIGAVELDSWFYPHEISRSITALPPLAAGEPVAVDLDGADGADGAVPPTGMLAWEARPDVLPAGLGALADTLGRPPLILHSRHISPASPYLGLGDWWVELAAHPVDPAFFRRWFDDARRWGAVCVEQDWMVLTWFGIRAMRSSPGRALDWQQGLDRAAADTGVDLMWCMATPGDLMATVELDRVVAVRTCDDYRYAQDRATLWIWYLTNNLLARALGLAVFKDCFLSADPGPAGGRFDGDPHHEVEALLSAFSGGPAGIGDRIGRTDPAIVSRLCRPDGRLVQPDHPLALTDDCLFDPPGSATRQIHWGATRSGPWRYLVAIHTGPDETRARAAHRLDAEMLVYDWRTGVATVTPVVEVELEHRGWALLVCCPLTRGADGRRRALIGDPARYVTMGAARVSFDADGSARAIPAPGEGPVALRWWIEGEGLIDR